MRVVVTRPASEAGHWVDALEAAGYQTLRLPLIDIAPAPDRGAIERAWTQWSRWQAVMFVSAQAVRFFFACRPPGLQLLAHPTRCWATGPGTRKALLNAGVPSTLIDSPHEEAGQFDSEALWRVVKAAVVPQLPVLIVRGTQTPDHNPSAQTDDSGAGRDWLSQQLQASQVPVHFVVAYQRQMPAWSDAQRAQAEQAASDGSVWLMSSSQAVTHLSQTLPRHDWSRARGIATHARIALALQGLRFAEIRVSRPVLGDVMASLESLA